MTASTKNPEAATTGSKISTVNEPVSISKDTENQAEKEDLWLIMRKIEEDLSERASTEIIQPPVLFKMNEIPIIYENASTMVKGKKGDFKSRISALITSLGISKDHTSLAGFSRVFQEPITVVYVDTERNRKFELPEAIQQIRKEAGYSATENVPNFRYVSLIPIPRKRRTKFLKAFISGIRQTVEGKILIVYDILTDCVSNFNDVEESMWFLDWINRLIDMQNCTVLVVIHQNENSASDKAMGHLGSEAERKATTILKVSADHSDPINSRVTVTPTRTRKTRPPKPMILAYDQDIEGLVYDEYATLKQGINSDVINALSVIPWEGEIKQMDLAKLVQKHISNNGSDKEPPTEKTISNNINKVIKRAVPFLRDMDRCTISKKIKRKGSSSVSYLKLDNHGFDSSTV